MTVDVARRELLHDLAAGHAAVPVAVEGREAFLLVVARVTRVRLGPGVRHEERVLPQAEGAVAVDVAVHAALDLVVQVLPQAGADLARLDESVLVGVEAHDPVHLPRPAAPGVHDLDEAKDRHPAAALEVHRPLEPVAELRELRAHAVRGRLPADGVAHHREGLRIDGPRAAPRDGNGQGVDHRAQSIGAGLRVHLHQAPGVGSRDARREERAVLEAPRVPADVRLR